MPNVLDVFNGEAYTVRSLTLGIEKIPLKESRLSGLFRSEGVSTTMVAIEYKAGKLALIQTSKRGSGSGSVTPREKAKLYPFQMNHLETYDALMADDVQDVREFGQADQTKTIQKVLQTKLLRMRENHDMTHEYHRIGALQGIVLDADGTTEIVDLFDYFNITQEEVDFDLENESADVLAKCDEVRRIIRLKLNGRSASAVHAQCGEDFFRLLKLHASVKEAYKRLNEAEYLRRAVNTTEATDEIEELFFGNIRFQLYTGRVGDTDFVAADECTFYPVGMKDLFIQYWGPADYVETVNTIGKNFYAKQEPMKFGKGIEIEGQSNPCTLCTEPDLLVKGTTEVTEET